MKERRYRVLDELALVLYQRMRHLEPNRTERVDWKELTEDERDFYESCAETLANEQRIVKAFWEASGLITMPDLTEFEVQAIMQVNASRLGPRGNPDPDLERLEMWQAWANSAGMAQGNAKDEVPKKQTGHGPAVRDLLRAMYGGPF